MGASERPCKYIYIILVTEFRPPRIILHTIGISYYHVGMPERPICGLLLSGLLVADCDSPPLGMSVPPPSIARRLSTELTLPKKKHCAQQGQGWSQCTRELAEDQLSLWL